MDFPLPCPLAEEPLYNCLYCMPASASGIRPVLEGNQWVCQCTQKLLTIYLSKIPLSSIVPIQISNVIRVYNLQTNPSEPKGSRVSFRFAWRTSKGTPLSDQDIEHQQSLLLLQINVVGCRVYSPLNPTELDRLVCSCIQ